MGKKDKKKDAEKQEAKKKRQAEKATKAAKKRAQKEAKELGEESIEAILAEFQQREAAKTAVTVTPCEQPSPRAHFTMTALPNGEMLLFGGEFFDGEETVVYNELYRWNVERNEWRRIDSLNTPPPRCSHQAVIFKDYLYVFGGEYATLDQFHHYRDLWRLDLKTNAWEEIHGSGQVPTARSGHRMCVWRNYIVLFGGFYEAFRDTKWFNDLYLFSLQEMKWTKVEYPPLAQVPKPRSGCQMALHAPSDCVYVYGGYSKMKVAGQKAEGKVHDDMWMLNLKPVLNGGKPVWQKVSRKGIKPSPRSGAVMTYYKNKAILFGGVIDEEGAHHEMKSVFFNDLYAFDMERKRWYKLGLKLAGEKAARRRRKRRTAEDGDGEDVGDEEQEEEDGEEEEEADDEDDNERDDDRDLFGYIDESGQVVYVDPDADDEPADAESKQESVAPASSAAAVAPEAKPAEEEEEEKKKEVKPQAEEGAAAAAVASGSAGNRAGEKPVAPRLSAAALEEKKEGDALAANDPRTYFQTLTAPSPRINPCLMVRGHTLYIYGGVVELGDVEVTLDDCWALDLNKRDSWRRLLQGTMHTMVWRGETDTDATGTDYDRSDDEDDEDGSDEEDGEREGDDDEEEEGERRAQRRREEAEAKEAEASKKKKKSKKPQTIRQEIEQLQSELGVDEPDRTPLPNESLRDFYARTNRYWSNEALQQLPPDQPVDEKLLRRQGFALAEQRYQELQPILERLNELQEGQRQMEEEKKSHRKGRKV